MNDYFGYDPDEYRARVLDDADRSADLANGFNAYDALPGRDRAFSDVLYDALTPPLTATGELDYGQYPPPGHSFPRVG
ncbi:hypothetical protein [Yinghuangia soli]|uniref:Uncharacterized protein n=1 Tax=Yinghuangia soli TaxID=2908204 RepID=A0AA41Q4C8_9ACTN|nr:hypothetical protein [Yinghuangia soli]MCF2531325.1 hypothetical protein [Yinghuangia soli]